LKVIIERRLRELGHEVVDVGTDSETSVDYTDFAIADAEKVAHGEADRGVLICGSGAGMAIAANKVKGIRAALAVNPEAPAWRGRTTISTFSPWARGRNPTPGTSSTSWRRFSPPSSRAADTRAASIRFAPTRRRNRDRLDARSGKRRW
jgi:hypothetical protein